MRDAFSLASGLLQAFLRLCEIRLLNMHYANRREFTRQFVEHCFFKFVIQQAFNKRTSRHYL